MPYGQQPMACERTILPYNVLLIKNRCRILLIMQFYLKIPSKFGLFFCTICRNIFTKRKNHKKFLSFQHFDVQKCNKTKIEKPSRMLQNICFVIINLWYQIKIRSVHFVPWFFFFSFKIKFASFKVGSKLTNYLCISSWPQKGNTFIGFSQRSK